MDFAEAHAQKQLDQDEQREAAIRADERAKCREELREKIDELIDTVPDWQFADQIFRWANGQEAFR